MKDMIKIIIGILIILIINICFSLYSSTHLTFIDKDEFKEVVDYVTNDYNKLYGIYDGRIPYNKENLRVLFSLIAKYYDERAESFDATKLVDINKENYYPRFSYINKNTIIYYYRIMESK